MSDQAQWSMTVPTQQVDEQGNACVVAQVTDAATGETGTVTMTLTPARQLKVIADGVALTDYQAWSTA